MPKPRRRFSVTCSYCGETIEKTESQMAKSTSGLYFCNPTCKSRYFGDRRRGGEEVTCAGGCGKTFYRPAGSTQRYHDRSCAGVARMVEKVQIQCATPGCPNIAERYPSDRAAKTGRAFCDGCKRRGRETYVPKGRKGVMHQCEREGCTEEFYRRPSSAQKYHSRQCRDLATRDNRPVFTCEFCGDLFTVPPSLAAVNANRFCCREHMGVGNIARPLDRNHNGKPVRRDDKGYLWIWEPDHAASATYKGWLQEHRFVAEMTLGRPLLPTEDVHHADEVKDNNRPANLEVLTKSDHGVITQRSKLLKLAELEEYRRVYGPLPPDPDALA